MSIDRTWKVGALAEASGLTVRTLHHWDQIGLLGPSRRTAAGHREYTEPDVVRLYQILALRRLGLGLETIATCLDVGVDPVRLVGEHLAGVEAAIASLEALRSRLAHVHDELATERAPETATLIGVLQAMGGAGPEGGQALRRHLDEDQLRALQDRAAALGPAVHYLVEVEWPELYRRAEALRVAGVEPTAPEVRRLAARMDELGRLFNGGDSGLSGAVRAAWHHEPAAMSGDPTAPADAWHDLTAYLDRARA
ncbi:MerR family transcriptional regulator [Streptomyces sp. CB01881]|uniref:MerR family transcriptional regulator n=1 Tax=Streptomyces sp. CB01881 TaxID=2078691 RepID=UPI000CDCC46A|nr:MerR family transcriptional regulator [Streptomyces sp. CB01881]AUY52248.1 MerR family transcriptional regulator [Streptomyces sp. CB01881]TYC71672.1 MerR family transcriptional regulator [Streptomyces sp. CB01881]